MFILVKANDGLFDLHSGQIFLPCLLLAHLVSFRMKIINNEPFRVIDEYLIDSNELQRH